MEPIVPLDKIERARLAGLYLYLVPPKERRGHVSAGTFMFYSSKEDAPEGALLVYAPGETVLLTEEEGATKMQEGGGR